MATDFSTLSIDRDDLLRALFDTAVEGILIIDSEGNMVTANQRCLDMVAYELEEIIGKSVELLIPDGAAQRHSHHRSDFIQDPASRPKGHMRYLPVLTKNGQRLAAEISLHPFRTGKDVFIIAHLVDVTEQLRLQSIAQTVEGLEKELAQEKEVNELKSRFVSMASHEFRTPLATILSSVNLIEKYQSKQHHEKKLKHINRIRNNVRNLTSILNDFLSLTKLEEGKVAKSPESLNIVEMVSEIQEGMQLQAKTGQHIQYQHEGDKDSAVIDPDMFRNIVFNLLNNAIKYSPKEGKVHIRTIITDEQLFLEIQDRGMGIPEVDRPHLFERFFRANNVSHIQGTGLGLSIVKRYVDLLGGDITFSSELGKGTHFKLKFPLVARHATNQAVN